MTEHVEKTSKPGDQFLTAAEEALVAFERKEREFAQATSTGTCDGIADASD
jgi:hypothetical protein